MSDETPKEPKAPKQPLATPPSQSIPDIGTEVVTRADEPLAPGSIPEIGLERVTKEGKPRKSGGHKE